MPLYTWICNEPECSHKFSAFCKIADRELQKCPVCKAPARQAISAPKVHIFQPSWWNDIASKPLWIESKKQLKEECEKHGCMAVGELD